MAQIVDHADGVYLGLTSESYHRDSALGSTSIKRLRKSPVKWWWDSVYNTIQPPEKMMGEEEKYRLGTAAHVALLEGTDGGLDTYQAAYAIEPDKSTHPKALAGGADYRAWLSDMGMSTTGPTNEVLIRRILERDPSVEILELLKAEFKRSGVRAVSAAEDARIRLLHRVANASPTEFGLPDGEVITLREAFRGGLSEVSVFWTDETGVRMKARFDKLKPLVTIDLKTFADWRDDRDFNQGLLREVKFRGYAMQAMHYEVAREALRDLVHAGEVHDGTPAQRTILEEIADQETWAWLWVFAITDGAPIIKGVRPDMQGPQMQGAAQDRQSALTDFLFYREMFGLEPGRMWFDPVAIWSPEESDWPIMGA